MNVAPGELPTFSGRVRKRLFRIVCASAVAAGTTHPSAAQTRQESTYRLLSQSEVSHNSEPADKGAVEADYKSATYTIAGVRVALKDGASRSEVLPRSATQRITRYFGDEVHKDLDGSGQEDVAFLVTQQTGGSGTFYYLVAALKRSRGYVGSNGFFLGDRIEPQEVISGPGTSVIVRYLDRAPGMAFTAPASVTRSARLELDPKTLVFREVTGDDELARGSAQLAAEARRWVWLRAAYRDGTVIAPRQEGKFSLTFATNGTFTATTDCNALSGSYTAQDNALTFGVIASTRMYCENSQEQAFEDLLTQTKGYRFSSSGELLLDLKVEGGTALFR